MRERKIKGLRLWGESMLITHHQFVDDIMLFGELSLREVRRLKKILDVFVEALGMEINKEKSSNFIFNTPESIKVHLTKTLGYRRGEIPTKYIGKYLALNPTRVSNWYHTIDKLKHRLESWSLRMLNIARRIFLSKSILKAIPIYPLSIMTTPKGIYSKIKEILWKLLWGGPKQEKKWPLVSWKELSKHKEEGGLEIEDPEILNQVLREKIWWRWMRGGRDIWKQI